MEAFVALAISEPTCLNGERACGVCRSTNSSENGTSLGGDGGWKTAADLGAVGSGAAAEDAAAGVAVIVVAAPRSTLAE